MDLSGVTELAPFTEVVRDVVRAAERAEARIFVTGAFARDLWLWHGHQIRTGRATGDVDFAVQCQNWDHFERLSENLLRAGFHRPDELVRHRFRHHHGTLIDLVPFGGIERADRTISWPPEEDRQMSLLGFREVLGSARPFVLPGGISVPVVSLPCLAALKLVAWRDRRHTAPVKDAVDLQSILRNYGDAGNLERMFEEIPGLENRENFAIDWAGAELLGIDLAKAVNRELVAKLKGFLDEECDPNGELRLARDMNRGNEDEARRLLDAFRRGLASRDLANP